MSSNDENFCFVASHPTALHAPVHGCCEHWEREQGARPLRALGASTRCMPLQAREASTECTAIECEQWECLQLASWRHLYSSLDPERGQRAHRSCSDLKRATLQTASTADLTSTALFVAAEALQLGSRTGCSAGEHAPVPERCLLLSQRWEVACPPPGHVWACMRDPSAAYLRTNHTGTVMFSAWPWYRCPRLEGDGACAISRSRKCRTAGHRAQKTGSAVT